MLRILRRTFSRRGRRPKTSANTKSNVAESGIHIPERKGKKGKHVIVSRVVLLDGTDVSVDVDVSLSIFINNSKFTILFSLHF